MFERRTHKQYVRHQCLICISVGSEVDWNMHKQYKYLIKFQIRLRVCINQYRGVLRLFQSNEGENTFEIICYQYAQNRTVFDELLHVNRISPLDIQLDYRNGKIWSIWIRVKKKNLNVGPCIKKILFNTLNPLTVVFLWRRVGARLIPVEPVKTPHVLYT